MIENPTAFDEAIQFLLDKGIDTRGFDAAKWATMAPDVKERAFFSANVENARFLQRARDMIADFLSKTVEEATTPDGEKTTRLRVGGRAQFVKEMWEFMVKEGMIASEELQGPMVQDIRDIKTASRLRLIFDTQTRMAYGYGGYVQGMEPAVLEAFPAARFIREFDVMTPRDRHFAGLGDVRMKTDTAYWADWQNDPEIGGFGVPYPPFGYNSGMGMEDVSREEAIQLGLNVDAVETLDELPQMNDGLKASTDGMDSDIKSQMLARLRAMPSQSEIRRRAYEKGQRGFTEVDGEVRFYRRK